MRQGRNLLGRHLRPRRLALGVAGLAVGLQGLGSVVSASGTVYVACGDTAGLASAIQSATSGTVIYLNSNNVSGCKYIPITTYDNGNGPDALPAISTALTIHGNGSTIGYSDQNSAAGRILEVGAGGYLTLTDTTVANGGPNYPNILAGAGIFSHGRLALLHATVSGNEGGGQIYTDGSDTTLTDSVVTASFYGSDAEIVSCCGSLTLSRSQISNNRAYDHLGGGIRAGGNVTITDSTISRNCTCSGDIAGGGSGGGMYFSSGTLRIERSTFSENGGGSGGGLWASGTVELYLVDFTNNNVDTVNSQPALGGGIYFSGGSLAYHGGSVTGNTAQDVIGQSYADGGGFYGSVSSGDVCGVTFSNNRPNDVAPSGALPGCSSSSGGVTCKPVSGAEGHAISGVVATFTSSDPSPASIFTSVDWGDGSRSPGSVSGAGTFQVSAGHVYAEGGRYPVEVDVSGPDIFGSCTGLATISDPALHLRMAGSPLITPVSTPLDTPLAYLTDDDRASTAGEYTATIYWGDGTPAGLGTVTGSGGSYEVRGNHLYLRPGTYKLTIKVIDAGGSRASASTNVLVA